VIEAKDRLRRVFLFLKERAKLDSPVERTIDPEAWQLRISDLPLHPAIAGALVTGVDAVIPEDRADVVLEVRRPVETPCPVPGQSIRDWLAPGWDKVDADVSPLSALARDEDLRVELFDDDPRRGTSFVLWRNLRDDWRRVEIPNRSVISTYEHLFALRARLHRESERYRVLLGDGWLVLDHEDGPVRFPMLLQELELEFDERVPSLLLRVADPVPELNTALLQLLPEVDVASIAAARELVEQKSASLADRDRVEELVANVANLLFPNSKLERGPIIFLGSRAGTIQAAADRFLEALDQMEELPQPLVDVVMDVPRKVEAKEVEPLFTLPANREQEEILRRLEKNGSVVVQGPPGTGKTHTIANLIGHLLAEGKTVLVTSHTAKALRVLRDKVVPELQALCVAYLESDLRGREQLESSVNGIVARLSLPAGGDDAIANASLDRGRLASELVRAEKALDRALKSEVDPIAVGARTFMPIEAAERIREKSGVDDWIPSPVEPGATLPLLVSEVHELYRIQGALPPSDEAELTPDLPPPEVIAAPESYAELIRRIDLLEHDRREGASIFRGPPAVAAVLPVVSRAVEAISWITSEEWLARCMEECSRGGAFLDAWDDLRKMIGAALDAHEAFHAVRLRRDLLLPPIDPEIAQTICSEIVEHLGNGGGLSWLARLGRSHWTDLIDNARIDGRPAASKDDFEALAIGYRLESAAKNLEKRWKKQLVVHGAPPLPEAIDDWPKFLEPYEQRIARAKLWCTGERSSLEADLDGAGVSWDAIDPALPREVAIARVIVPALEALKRRERLAELMSWERRLVERLANATQSAVGRALLDAVKERDVEGYQFAFERLSHLSQQRSTRERRRRLLDRLHEVAPAWVTAIEARTSPHDGAHPPGDVEDAWMHAQLVRALDARAQVDLDELQRKVVELRDRLHQQTAELVAKRAWAQQVDRTSPQARRSLTGWLDYQKQIGKGTGKRAPMLQRKALELLSECKDSVPVWIMPLSKVIESYDLATARFDVVIIDEASQCDVNGLFAFGLARRVVVVGDDQQVSPLAVGQKLDPIQSLIDLHLEGIPNKELYTGRLSIYDLARQSQSAIRLREHFRCVPEIISFSSRLAYDGEIQALREGASAMVGPPVIEHHVAGSCDERNLNTPEAIEVAALVAACAEQPEYEDATMGVISLLGDEQYALIERFLHAWLEPQEIERRRLLCGAPAHFQGDERDVVFMSMVWSSQGSPLAMNDNAEFKKRLNVAASRARDQMWVVHSLDPDVDLKPNDLRRRIIEHARTPRALLDPSRPQPRASTDLERKILDRLVTQGFRVKRELDVGAVRLDLVVEGQHGRAAIECDPTADLRDPVGQSPPSHLRSLRSLRAPLADRSRRQQLERLGWRFICVRGTSFVLDPDRTMEGVVERLKDLGIDPIGPEQQRSHADALRDRVVRRAAELRQAIWDRLGEQETLERARRSKKRSRAPLKSPDLRRSRSHVCRELQKIEPRLYDPRCVGCGSVARLEITHEGIIVSCMDAACGEQQRVDVHTLQRLADHLGATCASCGGRLNSRSKAWGNLLRCDGPCWNVTWERFNDQVKESDSNSAIL
jgi:hypothetical protein